MAQMDNRMDEQPVPDDEERLRVLERRLWNQMYSSFSDTYSTTWESIETDFQNKTMNEKVEFMYQLWKNVDLFTSAPIRYSGAKDAVESRSYLRLARQALSEFAFDKAIQYATRCLAYAPNNDTTGLSSAYDLRSEVLFLQHKYILAIMDINSCLQQLEGIHEAIQQRLLQRKNECHRLFNEPNVQEQSCTVSKFQ